MVRGPDGDPYVIDRATKAVYRINLKTKNATLVVKNGHEEQERDGRRPALPGVGGQDLLILDSKNVLWRWRPADDTGKGTLTKVTLQGSASLGDDIMGINTFLRPGRAACTTCTSSIRPSSRSGLYSPAADGSGFPAKPTPAGHRARRRREMTSTYVDGDFFVAEGGALVRFVGGKSEGWTAKAPEGQRCSGRHRATRIVASGSARREGDVYGFDRPNAPGHRPGQVRRHVPRRSTASPAVSTDWSDLRGDVRRPGAEGQPSTLVWMSSDGVNQAILVAVPDATPRPAPSASPSVEPERRARPRPPRSRPRSPDRTLP